MDSTCTQAQGTRTAVVQNSGEELIFKARILHEIHRWERDTIIHK